MMEDLNGFSIGMIVVVTVFSLSLLISWILDKRSKNTHIQTHHPDVPQESERNLDRFHGDERTITHAFNIGLNSLN
ncbi:hypothetical protein NEF87_002354 [Candidatus Lokiarchaeum ossiferum]|uniref:Uncharacterized protein n=1 Tax=Candidatus Lokiarchaeum ossiferum TaxID=2951803 RepID=A0ABY6HU48_9ARCH|nr:hypothetical protein NEF87_002354 [Candidatus Lokiarchaeum sp. B-35]